MHDADGIDPDVWYFQLPADSDCILNCLWKAIKGDAEQERLEIIPRGAKNVLKIASLAVAEAGVLNRMIWLKEEEVRAARPVGVDNTDKSGGLEV